jgi:hypothetical protein
MHVGLGASPRGAAFDVASQVAPGETPGESARLLVTLSATVTVPAAGRGRSGSLRLSHRRVNLVVVVNGTPAMLHALRAVCWRLDRARTPLLGPTRNQGAAASGHVSSRRQPLCAGHWASP